MGSVYLAEDEHLRRRVALKVILPELGAQDDFRRRFEAEARAAAAIDHPNVVPILSAGSAEGHLYLAMRFIDGEDLNQALSEQQLDPGDAVRITEAIAGALDAAHAAGLVHRDVTPANILLQGELGKSGVYLTDFGLVRAVDSTDTRLTNTGQLIANLDYASPEQVTTGWVDARTDVYSLGCVLFRMLSGSRPFPGTDTQKMWKIVNEPVPPIPGPGAFNEVIARATAKDPSDRFASAGDLAKAVRAALEGRSASGSERSVASGPAALGYSESAEEGSATEPLRTEVFVGEETATRAMPTKHRLRRRLWIAAAGIGVLVAAAAIAILIAGNHEGKSNSGGKPSWTSAPVASAQPASTKKKTTKGATSGDPARFQGQIYSVAPPTGWARDPEVVEEPPYYANKWLRSDADESTYLRVEGDTAVEGQDPVEAEEGSRRKTSKSPDYHEIGYGPVTVDGRSAVQWDYEVEGDRRVIYGFVECGTGLAVVGSASPSTFTSYERDFEVAADSLRANCAGNSPIPVVKLFGAALVRPSTLYVSPTAGPSGENLAWTGWGRAKAVGTGKMVYDTCDPDCSRGYGSTHGRVILSELRDCEGQMQYAVVRLIYDGLPEHNFRGEYDCDGEASQIHFGE